MSFCEEGKRPMRRKQMRHKDTGKEQAGSQALQEKLIESKNNRDGKVLSRCLDKDISCLKKGSS